MNKAFRNIETIQNELKDSVNCLLIDNGYSLINQEKFGDNQMILHQWINRERNHSFQLVWDIREQWFDLGEFNRINNLNYIESNNIDFFPFSVIGVFFRNRYNAYYISKIKTKIEEKLSAKKTL